MAVIEVTAWTRYTCRTCGWTKKVTEAGRHALVGASHLCNGRHFYDPDVRTHDYVFLRIIRPTVIPIKDPEEWQNWLDGDGTPG